MKQTAMKQTAMAKTAVISGYGDYGDGPVEYRIPVLDETEVDAAFAASFPEAARWGYFKVTFEQHQCPECGGTRPNW